MSKKLVTQGTLPHATKHLTKPCTDCPLRRDSLRGWLGGSTAEQYARLCHTDAVVKCHVHEGSRCAGLAIYRSNTCKSQPKAHALPSDHDIVFSNIMQFTAHHQTVSLDTGIPVSEQNQEPSWANRPVMPASTGNPVDVTYESLHKIREIFEQADAENLKQQADSLVSYDIDDLSIEQLRHHYRCLLLSGRESNLMHIKEKGVIALRLLDAESTAKTLLDALLNALPYVEDVLCNPAELACFKKGVVQKHATQIRAAIALAEKHEDSQPLNKHGQRDQDSNEPLPFDHEVAAAMRLVVSAGGAV